MVSAHWTAPVMTPVMLGQYWGEVRKHVYAPADFYSPAAPNEPFILGKLSTLFRQMEILGSCQKGLLSLNIGSITSGRHFYFHFCNIIMKFINMEFTRKVFSRNREEWGWILQILSKTKIPEETLNGFLGWEHICVQILNLCHHMTQFCSSTYT